MECLDHVKQIRKTRHLNSRSIRDQGLISEQMILVNHNSGLDPVHQSDTDNRFALTHCTLLRRSPFP